VLSAIQFDHQLTLEAGEIDDKTTDNGLPTKLAGFDLSAADAVPKALFQLRFAIAGVGGHVAVVINAI
jgi:hypothetical protein